MPTPLKRFPKRFLWGAATSAHQVEGGTYNQWTLWEKENAKSLAHSAEYKLAHLASWDKTKQEATNPENYISGQATDHYHRYEEDFDLMQQLNFNAFRFSIEWSRIEPTEGAWDPAEIEHYRQYIRALKARGMEPMVTLFHWSMPVWFAEKGGFEKARNIKYFVRYADKVLQELGRDLRYITTINEPDTMTYNGYISLEHPPQKHSLPRMIWTYRNLLESHRQIYKVAHQMSRRFKVGFTKSYAMVEAGDDRWQTKFMVRFDYFIRDDIEHTYLRGREDFIGVNYYFHDRRLGFQVLDHPDKRVNDLGWEMVPGAIEHVLKRLHKRYKKPIIVMENGVADMEDKHRQWWMARVLSAIHSAMDDGVRVEGYLHWSLLDNFEWAYGKWPRFGLFHVDYKTLKRTPRKSALWYGKLIKQLRGL